jgi:hypothetical protein
VISTYRDALTLCIGYCAEDYDPSPVIEALQAELAVPTGA